MFELLVIACIDFRICEYIVSPLRYPEVSSCYEQGAIVAGTIRGKYHSGSPFKYEVRCLKRVADPGDAPDAVSAIPAPADHRFSASGG